MVGGNLCVLWSTSGGDTRGGALLTVWSSRAIRRGRAASGRRQTWLGDVRVVRAEGLGSGAWVARRLACGGGWDFKRGRERRPRAAANCSFGQDRYQTSLQGWRRP